MIDKTNSPGELLDLVDENDQVIGTVTKGEANQNPKLIHREIAIIIYDEDNKILIQKRGEKKTIDPGLWTISVAGHIPKDMSPQDAAHMELKEELGFNTSLVFINKQLLHYDNETHFACLYKGKYTGQKINFDKEEIQKVKFISRKDLEKMSKKGEKIEPYSIKRMRNFWKERIQ